MSDMNRAKQLQRTPRPPLLQKINFIPDRTFTLIGLAVVIAAGGLLVYNSFYGICTPDEAFYPVIPFRMMHGAKPFVTDWHASQLVAILQYPPVWLFAKLTGGFDGIILYSRILFDICQTFASCVIFVKMKRYGFANALLGALLFELYVPEYTLALDYYTISMLSMLAIVFLLLFSKRLTPVTYIVCGLLLACAVLAEPSFVVIYVLWFAAVIVLAALKKAPHPALMFKPFCFLTAGVAVAAAVFFAFLFSKETPAEFFANFWNVFRSGEYSPNTLFSGYGSYLTSLWRDYSWTAAAAAVYLAALLLDRNRQKRKVLWALAGFVITAAMILMTAIKAIEHSNLLSFISPPFALAFMGISAYILLKNKKRELLLLWLSGLLYIVLICMISEAMIYAGSSGFSASCIAAVPLISELCRELTEEAQETRKAGRKAAAKPQKAEPGAAKAAPALAVLVCISALCIYTGMMLSRDPVSEVFLRKPLRETVMVDRGAYQGIRISPEQKKVYDDILEDIALIESRTDGRYTLLSDNLWTVYSSDRDPLTFMLWYEVYLLTGGVYEDYFDFVGEYPAFFYLVDSNFYWGPAGERKDVSTALTYVTEHYDCTVTRGAAGYILEVKH